MSSLTWKTDRPVSLYSNVVGMDTKHYRGGESCLKWIMRQIINLELFAVQHKKLDLHDWVEVERNRLPIRVKQFFNFVCTVAFTRH